MDGGDSEGEQQSSLRGTERTENPNEVEALKRR